MLRRLRQFSLAFLVSVALAHSAPPPLFDQVGPILAGLSQITGWKVEHKVPAEMLPQAKFRQYMQDHMKDTSPKEIRAQELVLKMFGLVPKDFNLASETVDLLSEQAAAFYDYNRKRLFILDTAPSEDEQRLALAHELAHALADQHYHLGKYMHDGSVDDDAATAREAVMEGQASWLSWAYLSLRNGGKGEVPPRLLNELSTSAGAAGDDFPVYSSAPLYIRESLVFPYNEGTRFQDAVYRKLGRGAFDEVFRHPPQSTGQILHPDAYFASRTPSMPPPPALEPLLGKEARQFRTLTEGVLGEFDFSALLRQYTSDKEGAATAAHVRGGAYRLYEHKREKYAVLAYSADFDSAEAAHAYFEQYQRVLKAKWKKMDIATETASVVTGSGDSGRFNLRLSGTCVQSVEGMIH